MSNYKLVYFNLRGGAEVLRFIFAQAGVTYEDKRVEREQWPEMKPTTRTGQMPYLEVDGTILTGSRPIAEFLAKRFNLGGNSDIEDAQLGGIVDFLFDFFQKLYPWFGEQDETKKAAALEVIKNEHVPRYWGTIEKWIQENKSEAGWVFGNKLTYVDFFIYSAVDFLSKLIPEMLSNYPAVAKNKAAVEALPNIAKWIKERPVTDQ